MRLQVLRRSDRLERMAQSIQEVDERWGNMGFEYNSFDTTRFCVRGLQKPLPSRNHVKWSSPCAIFSSFFRRRLRKTPRASTAEYGETERAFSRRIKERLEEMDIFRHMQLKRGRSLNFARSTNKYATPGESRGTLAHSPFWHALSPRWTWANDQGHSWAEVILTSGKGSVLTTQTMWHTHEVALSRMGIGSARGAEKSQSYGSRSSAAVKAEPRWINPLFSSSIDSQPV